MVLTLDALSHLFVNHLSLFDATSRRRRRAAGMLNLYATVPGHFLGRQSEGLLNVAAHPSPGASLAAAPTFGRGVAVKLSMSDRAPSMAARPSCWPPCWNPTSPRVSINSFVETHVDMIDRAEQLKWPTRFGRRPTF